MVKLKDLPLHVRNQILTKILNENQDLPSNSKLTNKLLIDKKNHKSILVNNANDPQYVLTQAVLSKWPDRAISNYKVFEDRRYKLDIAFPDTRLAIEVDGWQYHGKYKADFQNDRIRQNLLTLADWHILRFFYKEIMNVDSLNNILKTIENIVDKPISK